MAQFLFVYHMTGPMPADQAEIDASMKQWETWMGSLGEALVNPGNPVGKSSTVSADGVTHNGGPNPVAGFSIYEAPDLEAAIAAAQGCPILAGGTVEVAPIIAM